MNGILFKTCIIPLGPIGGSLTSWQQYLRIRLKVGATGRTKKLDY